MTRASRSRPAARRIWWGSSLSPLAGRGKAGSVRQILRHRFPAAVLDLAEHRAVGAEVLRWRERILIGAEHVRREFRRLDCLVERARIEVLAGSIRRHPEQVDDLPAVD